jgi:branched-chain amino acid transport system permease protein
MADAILILTNSLVLASMYVLVALGFAFLLNLLGIFNFAHGAIYMVGGYVGFVFIAILGLNWWVGFLLAVLTLALWGLFQANFFFRPYIGDFNRILMGCVAITVIMQTGVNVLAGSQYLALPPFIKGMLTIGTVDVSYERILTFVIGVVLLGVTIWFVKRTKWGQQMQAISQNVEGAALQGIRVPRILALASSMGCGLATVGGCLLGSYGTLEPWMGDFMMVKVLVLAILAGAGSISGILYTGLILGVLDSVLPVYLPGTTTSLSANAITAAIVVVLILIRPKGFFGHGGWS